MNKDELKTKIDQLLTDLSNSHYPLSEYARELIKKEIFRLRKQLKKLQKKYIKELEDEYERKTMYWLRVKGLLNADEEFKIMKKIAELEQELKGLKND